MEFDFYFSAQQQAANLDSLHLDSSPVLLRHFVQGKEYTLCTPRGERPKARWPDLTLVHTGTYTNITIKPLSTLLRSID